VNTESDLTTYLNLINPNDVIIIEDENGVKNYTFTLDLVEEGKLTNLVVQDNNGSYTYNLIEYTADDMAQWLDDVYVNESTLNTATASVTDLGKVTPPMCTTMEFTCPSGNHGSGSYDSCYYKDLTMWSYHIVPTSCDDGGGGSGGEGPITDPSNPSGGGGGSNPVIITTPTKTLQPWEEVLACLSGIGFNGFNGEIAWLQDNKSGTGQIKDFIQDENGNCIPENKDIAMDFLSITGALPNAQFLRYQELNALLEINPWALIQDCAQQNGLDIANYQYLYEHTIPQECQTRLDNLGSGYSNQSISDGNVPCANMDYYGVEITNYPDFDNDGNPDTEAQIHQAFREKFTDLASGEEGSFESECDFPFDNDDIIDIWWQFNPMSDFDSDLFLSTDPISSIMLIDAGANNPFVDTNADLGAIIVSDFTSNDWTISTIQTPETETQPFSGNRQWGWIINQNGNLELYTRAVDVARVADIFLEWPATWLGSDIECQQDTYYDIADATWQNLQQEIAQWVNDNGGQAVVNTPKAVRVDKEKIVEILTTNQSIDQILSNCN